VGLYTGRRAREACDEGRGVLGEDWPGRAVAGSCRDAECAAHSFWELAVGWEWRNGRAIRSSHIGAQVFDGGDGGLTGKGVGAAAPARSR
jgi:hypothetical protein